MDILSETIIDQLSTGRVTAKKIATDIGLSERTISRRLVEYDTTFDDVMDDIRKDLALRYLDSDEVKLSELGFSSHASFTASFKRWTGRMPSETRTLS